MWRCFDLSIFGHRMKLPIFLLFLIFSYAGTAQSDTLLPNENRHAADTSVPSTIVSSAVDDTILATDTAIVAVPEIEKPVKHKSWQDDTLFTSFFKMAAFPSLQKQAVYQFSDERETADSDWIFYVMLGFVLFLALIKMGFKKYFSDMFRLQFVYFFKNKQMAEQLIQHRIPALLFNILFCLSAGAFLSILLVRSGNLPIPFSKLFWLSVGGVALVYVVKYTTIKLLAFIFGMNEAGSQYLFLVFQVAKTTGIFILPLLFFIIWGDHSISFWFLWAAGGLFILSFLYRYTLFLTSSSNQLRVRPVHFFIYFCALEIAPVLVIAKLLLEQTGIRL